MWGDELVEAIGAVVKVFTRGRTKAIEVYPIHCKGAAVSKKVVGGSCF